MGRAYDLDCKVCGRPAQFKAMCSVYSLGVVPRLTKSGTTIPVCEKCLPIRPEGIDPRLTVHLVTALAEAANRSIEVLDETRPASKRK